MSKSVALLLVLVFLTASCLMVAKPAVVNDVLYAIGGSNTANPGALDILADNDQYKPIGYGTPDPSSSSTSSPSPPLAQEHTSTPETKQSISIPPMWLIAIAALGVVIIIELIIYFLLLKGKKSKS